MSRRSSKQRSHLFLALRRRLRKWSALRVRFNWKIFTGFVTTVALGAIAWSALTHIEPRVARGEAAARLRDVDQDVQALVMEALNSEERAATVIDFFERNVDSEYVIALNRLSVRATQARRPLLDHAHMQWQHDMLLDVGDLVATMGSCGSLSCDDVEAALQEHIAATSELIRRTCSLGDITEASNEVLRISTDTKTDKLIKLNQLLMSAASNEDMLIRKKSPDLAFSDIKRMQVASWRLHEIHQQLHRDYQEANRIATALKLLFGR